MNASSNVLAPGSTVGRYQIERLLGAGAMGEVYLAVDPHIERRLAIKTVRVAGGRPADVDDRKKRLLREARAAGRLLHPNVVTLFDAGEHEGLLYLAFELVEGSDLASRLDAGPLSLGEILRIVAQAARALECAHEQGIVHRDIKPSNIMVDAAGRVKVADFGIAKVTGQNTELTVAGSVMGSPQYLSPEQIRGEELDGRSDIFSLGVVLYELLSGKRPFNGETLTTLVFQILQQEPPRISALRSVPPRLERLLERMLAKDRESRYAQAGEVADELAAIEREMSRESLTAPVALATEQLDETLFVPPRSAAAAPGLPPPPPPLPSSSAAASGSGGTSVLPPPPVSGSSLGIAPPPPPASAPPSLAPPFPPSAPAAAPPMPPYGAPPVREGKNARFLVAAAVIAVVLGVGIVGAFFLWSRGRAVLQGAAESATTDLTAALTTDSPLATDLPPGPAAPFSSTSRPEASTPEPSAAPDPRTASLGEVVPQTPPSPTPGATPRSPEVREPVPVPPPGRQVAPPVASPTERPQRPVPPAISEPEPEEEPAPRRPAGRPTGMNVLLRINPPDAFFLLDGRVIGRASEYGTKPFRLPDPGPYELKFKRDGYTQEVVQIEASEVAGTTPVSLNLKPLPAGEVASNELPVHRVRIGVAFRVTPANALVSIDGRAPVSAQQYRGGRMGRGEFLELPPGRHRLVFTAPGHRRRDIVVEVTGGAEEERLTVPINLPRGED